MVRHRSFVYAATVAVSAAAGWFARGPAPTPVEAPASVIAKPLVVMASDGKVALDETARQGRRGDVNERARPPAVAPAASAANDETVVCAQRLSPVDGERLRQAIERGSETERFEGLMQARSAGMLVDEQTLKALYETDASERVRVAAFESYLEWRADRPTAWREALDAALYVPSAAIQREAKRRLEEVREAELGDAHAPQGVP